MVRRRTFSSEVFHANENQIQQKVIHLKSELDKYKELVMSYEQEGYYDQINQLTKENEELQAKLQEALEKEQHLLSSVQEKYNEMHAIQEEQQTKIEKQNNLIDKLEDQNTTLKEEREEFYNQIQQTREQEDFYTKLEENIKHIEKEKKELEGFLIQKDTETNHLTNQLKKNEELYDSLLLDFAYQENQFRTLKKRYHQEQEEWQRQYGDLEKENNHLKKDIAHFEANQIELYRKLSVLNQQLRGEHSDEEIPKEVELDTDFQTKGIQQLEDQIYETIQQVNEFGDNLSKSESIIHYLEEQIDTFTKEVETLKGLIEDTHES
ncbi:hypothetical protein [Pontibacillus yanchengensis]|uniref:Uncharacterized protein n=1 Tax=Pontibacillus yanchengensis Y32 TaxID=1385514 RepID=A0A0A2TDC9_9BACI|nr:hypothetical protein [Pontibacillus yanchengensis]KGP72408.1 hypothetical protein N782_11995 [Pontibacillus yanchengensis Y32]